MYLSLSWLRVPEHGAPELIEHLDTYEVVAE
jgi:hypothetical protein